MTGPAVSVVLPVFNGAGTVAASIDSILGQTFGDLELLVVDDGSTDGTADIVASYADRRVRYVANGANVGIARALNRGIELARAPWIARMDADDVALPRRLERQVQAVTQHPEWDACGSFTIKVAPDGTRLRRGNMRPGRVRRSWAWLPSPFGHGTVMIRTDVARRNPYSEDALHCEDYELFLRLTHAGYRLHVLRRSLVLSLVHAESITSRHRRVQLTETHRVFRRYYPHAEVAADEFEVLIGSRQGDMSFRRRLALMREICRPDPVPAFLVGFALKSALRPGSAASTEA
jgi:glycosyltransferase involved in cell wall biosynthesis